MRRFGPGWNSSTIVNFFARLSNGKTKTDTSSSDLPKTEKLASEPSPSLTFRSNALATPGLLDLT